MASMAEMRSAWAEVLLVRAKADPRLMVLDGDLASSTMAQNIAYNAPDSFMNMGIAEQNMMGVAAGMATLGLIPWLSSFACFLTSRTLDQLRVSVAQPNLSVKLAGHFSGSLTNKTGKTHIEVGDLAVMRAMPNLTVVAPADSLECAKATDVLTDLPGPAYLRLTRDAGPVVFGDDYVFQLGKVVELRDGRDVTIFATGPQSVRALEASDSLAKDGISAHVVHVHTIKPIDVDGIVAAAKKTGRVLTTEDHNVIGGLGAAVAEVLCQHHPVLMRIHGLQDCFGESGTNDAILEKYGLSARHIAAAVKALLSLA